MKRLVEIVKKAGEGPESMKFAHNELQELALALIKMADLQVILVRNTGPCLADNQSRDLNNEF